jgi:hypothetical protein
MADKRQGLAPAKLPKMDVIGIKVRFTLTSKNGLRRVVVGLEKDSEGEEVHWLMDFQLFERQKKSEEFGDAFIELQAGLDTTLNKKAEAVAQHGLTAGQAAHALGPAADDLKAAESGEIDVEEARETIAATLKKK